MKKAFSLGGPNKMIAEKNQGMSVLFSRTGEGGRFDGFWFMYNQLQEREQRAFRAVGIAALAVGVVAPKT